jgi:RNA 2',3'-cyclic 3'-phosphodiesterase
MIQRIFIAIDLPQEMKDELAQIQSSYDLPVSWIVPENLHVTLLFLGAIQAKQVKEVARVVDKTAQKHSKFSLSFSKVCYGPDSSLPPRLVWMEGEKSSCFNELKKEIDRSLREKNLYYPTGDSGENRIHVTLGRVRKWDWAKMNPENQESVNRLVDFVLPVENILVMESRMIPGRPPKYTVLESISLKQ